MKHTYNEEEKEAIAQLVFNTLRKVGAWGGEMVAQDDDAQIEAINLLCELADVKDVVTTD